MARNEVPYPVNSEQELSIFRNFGKPMNKGRTITLPPGEREAAHLYALLNCQEVEQYLSVFDAQVCSGLDPFATQQMRASHFPAWFKGVVTSGMCPVTPALHCLALGPATRAKEYNGFLVNGFRFHVEGQGRRGTSGSGVCVRGISGADADPSNYYGKLQRVYALDYHGYSVFVFRCKWYDTINKTTGIWTLPKYGLVEVNPNRDLPVNEPFILASQASQVYYTLSAGNHHRTVTGRRGWYSVVSTRARHVIQGFTTTTDVPTDDESEQENNAQRQEYQDDTVPRLNHFQENATDEDIQLATGGYEVFTEDNVDPADRFSSENDEDQLEDFSSDDYPDE